jgi:hypothetical protein
MFRAQGFTGFETKPVRARYRSGVGTPPVLWELAITGWGGIAAPESGIELDAEKSRMDPNDWGYLKYTGLSHPEHLVDEDRWDGSDFFMVWPLPKYIFVSERVAEFIREKELTGARLVPLTEMRKSEGFTPGRLSHYMPDARAKELGEPLGIY